jgi:hypothetical protein
MAVDLYTIGLIVSLVLTFFHVQAAVVILTLTLLGKAFGVI